ncbi:hypothetical protein BDY21DRAFT_345385 [Lineolata rhizophorae]|uniref:Uncharacterized protein n=1 Tax=Lineolata rhizophorae TaxID=578093 RepID=A0A6A6P1C3_9PEZI|nr:hypothetical protein BDY21DRAFT_345385 [Lineolata rhizophorae]
MRNSAAFRFLFPVELFLRGDHWPVTDTLSNPSVPSQSQVEPKSGRDGGSRVESSPVQSSQLRPRKSPPQLPSSPRAQPK